jgi:hypothetical protein
MKRGVAVCVLVAGLAPAFGARVGQAQTPAAPPVYPPPPQVPPGYPPPPGYPGYPPPGPYYPPPRLAEPMGLNPMGPRVFLRSDGANPRLQYLGRIKWSDVCTAPCGVNVEPGGLYRIGGGTIRKSDPFQLPRASGDVVIDVQVGSNVKHFVGLGLMIGGLVSAGYGTFFWLAFHESAMSSSYSAASDNNAARDVAIVFGAITAVLEGIGIALFSSSTSVDVH